MRRRTATYPRALRVNQVLRQVVADELERLADADERMRMVTVTAVDTAPDLRTAVVYVATLDADASEALEERRSHLQRLIGSQTTMKRTPRLTFRADPAIAAGSTGGGAAAGAPRRGTPGLGRGRAARAGGSPRTSGERQRPRRRRQGGRVDVARRRRPLPASLRPAPGRPRRHARPRRHRASSWSAWAAPPVCCAS